MKTRTIALAGILFVLATAPVPPAQAQTAVPVQVSTVKVQVDGKIYLAHSVLEHQTLYGITKAYRVTEEDLYAANPQLKEKGLQAGTTILVPVVENQAPAFREHTVLWYEDLDDIATQYGVSAQEIMAANGMKTKKVSKRQVLRIPVKGGNWQPAQTADTAASEPAVPTLGETAVPVTGEQVIAQETEKPEENADGGIFDWMTGKGSVEMALLMPFNAAGKASETNMDFYSGVLMALRDLEAEGFKATINVFDLQDGVPTGFELSKNDFILGPVSAKDLTTVLERTGGRTPVISPLDQRAAELADSFDGFIQAPSTTDSQYADLAAWAAADAGTADRIILVTEKLSSGSTAPAIGIREALLAAGTTFEGVSWTAAEGRSLPSALTSRLTKGGVNRIIVASEKESFVGDMVRNLGILLGKGYKIAMYAPSRVRTFETVDGSAYHQNELHISSPYYVDYDADQVRKFVRSYRALYRTEPSQFAFQGYDLTRFFAGLCVKYGNRWTRALGSATGSGLHTDFRFEQTRSGSYRNTGIRRIIYNTDYSTELVR
jgi:LysM repeat protein/ABC-type branched-subunit amino acid transport system substrate-binding protein